MEITIGILFIGLIAVLSLVMAVLSMTATNIPLSRLLRHSDAANPLDVGRRESDRNLAFRDRLARLVLPFAKENDGDTSAKGAYASMRTRLIEAGFRRPAALQVYQGSRIAVGAGLAVLVVPFSAALLSDQPSLILVAVAMGAGLGFLLPGLFVDQRRRSRQSAIVRGLPDAIDLMVVCVEAGLSLGATLNRVAAEFGDTSPILASEFKLTVLQTQAGKSLANALKSLGDRNGVQDLSTLTSALIQTERLGTRIADTLRVQAEALRVRRLQRAEEVANRAPIKMLFPAVLLIFPALLIVILVPALLRLSSTLE